MVSHILDCRDAFTSPDGDAASPAGDAALTTGRCAHRILEMYHLLEICTSPTTNAIFPSGDVPASVKSKICDTAVHPAVF